MALHALLSSRYPSDPFIAMQRALRSFDGGLSTSSASALTVKLDVKEDEKSFHVIADLPGLSEKEIELSFDDGVLTISGEKKLARDEKTDKWHLAERTSGRFSRQLAIDAAIDPAKIEAKFEKGVLTVSLPKMPEEKVSGHKIEIKGA